MKNSPWVIVSIILLTACSHSGKEPAAYEDKRESGMVRISVEAQKHFGMQVETAQIHELTEYLQVSGTVQPADGRVSTVRPLARGRLHDILARIGDRVRGGQPLATYDNMEAGELAAQLAGAQADLERLHVQAPATWPGRLTEIARWRISEPFRKKSSSRPLPTSKPLNRASNRRRVSSQVFWRACGDSA